MDTVSSKTRSPTTRVVLGLGSNLGRRRAILSAARDALVRRGVDIRARSSVRETEPIGPPQPKFLNQVVLAETRWSARELLDVAKEIERQLGRDPGGARWGPRVIDIDILAHGDEIIDEPDLRVPHPEIGAREFVLGLWAEIDPHFRVPGLERTVAELLERWTGKASDGDP